MDEIEDPRRIDPDRLPVVDDATIQEFSPAEIIDSFLIGLPERKLSVCECEFDEILRDIDLDDDQPS